MESEPTTNFSCLVSTCRSFNGGKQISERMRDIREDFLKTLKTKLQQTNKEIAVLNQPLVKTATTPARLMVQAWTLGNLEPHLASITTNRSYKNGRQALLAANCLKCHRIGSTGAQIGPDPEQRR